MKATRKLFFQIGTILIVLAIGVVMFIIGRGHNIYIDNKTIENYNGSTIKAYYEVVVESKGNEPQTINARERIMIKTMGQKLKLKLTSSEKVSSLPEESEIEIHIPHSWDGAVINLPLLLRGYDESEWLSEYIQVPSSTAEKIEEVVTDEFSMTSV